MTGCEPFVSWTGSFPGFGLLFHNGATFGLCERHDEMVIAAVGHMSRKFQQKLEKDKSFSGFEVSSDTATLTSTFPVSIFDKSTILI